MLFATCCFAFVDVDWADVDFAVVDVKKLLE